MSVSKIFETLSFSLKEKDKITLRKLSFLNETLNNYNNKCTSIYNSNIYIIRNLILTLIKTIKNNNIVVDGNNSKKIFKKYLDTAKCAAQMNYLFDRDYEIIHRFYKYNTTIYKEISIIKNQFINDINHELIIISKKEKEYFDEKLIDIRNIGIQTSISEYIIKTKLIIEIIKTHINISDDIYVINNIVFDEFTNIIQLSYNKLITYANISDNFNKIIYDETMKRLEEINTNTKKRKYSQLETDVLETLISLKN